ncbi:MAG: hypothetical protein ACTSUE_09070 [Promethearchaeota archaeon]
MSEKTTYGTYQWKRAFFANVKTQDHVWKRHTLLWRGFAFWVLLLATIIEGSSDKKDTDGDGEPGSAVDGAPVWWIEEAPHIVMTAVLLYFVILLVYSFKIKTIDGSGKIPWPISIAWFCHVLGLSGSILSVIFYFSFLEVEETHNAVTSVTYMLFSIVMCIETWFGCMVVMLIHGWYIILFGALFSFYTWIKYENTDETTKIRYVYRAFNWETPMTTIGHMFTMLFLAAIVYGILYFVFKKKNAWYRVRQFDTRGTGRQEPELFYGEDDAGEIQMDDIEYNPDSRFEIGADDSVPIQSRLDSDDELSDKGDQIEGEMKTIPIS